MVNFFDPNLLINPYPAYKTLRETDPVHWSQILQVWVLTRYDDVTTVLRDPARFSSERSKATNPFVQQMESFSRTAGSLDLALTMLNLDPPAHTRLRVLANKAFTHGEVEGLRPRIREIAEDLLADVPADGKLDVMRDLAIPMPVTVIAELLGIPAADRARFKVWSRDIAMALAGPFQAKEAFEKAQKGVNELAGYFREQIALRHQQPGDDLLSGFVIAKERDDLLSDDEILATCLLLLIAGNENTSNFIGMGTLALLQNPTERLRLQNQPELMGAAVEEMLRYESPAQMTFRVANVDTELRGKEIKAGQVLTVVIGAANRDPEQFREPDRFDIGRPKSHDLAFGYGIHYCLGAPLALAEAEIAFEALLRKFPEPRADFETPQWGPSLVMRGLTSLPITADTEASA